MKLRKQYTYFWITNKFIKRVTTIFHFLPLLIFQKGCYSHLANTSAIRHAAAGVGCWFWLDPALVHSGCYGRASAFRFVFFPLKFSTFTPFMRASLIIESRFFLHCNSKVCIGVLFRVSGGKAPIPAVSRIFSPVPHNHLVHVSHTC